LQARWGFLPKSEATENQTKENDQTLNFDGQGLKPEEQPRRSNYSITALEWLPTWRMLE
jgi:hypothetical protein